MRPHLLANHPQEGKQQAQARGGVGGLVELLVEEGVAGAEGLTEILLQGFEPGRVFAQGAHHFVVIFVAAALAVFDGVHFGILFTGRGARAVGAPAVGAGGVEQLRSKLRRCANRHRASQKQK